MKRKIFVVVMTLFLGLFFSYDADAQRHHKRPHYKEHKRVKKSYKKVHKHGPHRAYVHDRRHYRHHAHRPYRKVRRYYAPAPPQYVQPGVTINLPLPPHPPLPLHPGMRR
jgi:hypothetical protein